MPLQLLHPYRTPLLPLGFNIKGFTITQNTTPFLADSFHPLAPDTLLSFFLARESRPLLFFKLDGPLPPETPVGRGFFIFLFPCPVHSREEQFHRSSNSRIPVATSSSFHLFSREYYRDVTSPSFSTFRSPGHPSPSSITVFSSQVSSSRTWNHPNQVYSPHFDPCIVGRWSRIRLTFARLVTDETRSRKQVCVFRDT